MDNAEKMAIYIGYTRRTKPNAKIQRNMCCTPLYANSMLSAVSHATK